MITEMLFFLYTHSAQKNILGVNCKTQSQGGSFGNTG